MNPSPIVGMSLYQSKRWIFPDARSGPGAFQLGIGGYEDTELYEIKTWHPDRCTASGNAKYMEEAKKKFQGIQQAYSVLSDTNKRFLYDVGVYDSDDDQNGLGDFLNEMVDIMCEDECNENGEESFEELQELYEELFQSDIDAFGSTSPIVNPSSCSSSSYASCGESSDAGGGKSQEEGKSSSSSSRRRRKSNGRSRN